MGVLPDWMIERDVRIDPFAPQQHRPGVISYGVTSYGYDVRVGRAFKVFTNVWGSTDEVLALAWGARGRRFARCGIIVNVTPLDPEWRGKVTIEISNTTPLPARIYAGEGIAQMIFVQGAADGRTSYADKKGKYQDQAGLTLPFVIPDAPAVPAGAKSAPKTGAAKKPKRPLLTADALRMRFPNT